MATPRESARKARTLAAETAFTNNGSRKIAQDAAKAAGKKLTPAEETRAAKLMQPRRMNDRERTASRAEFIARREDPRKKPSAGLLRAQAKDAANSNAIKKAAEAAAKKKKGKK